MDKTDERKKCSRKVLGRGKGSQQGKKAEMQGGKPGESSTGKVCERKNH